MIKMEISGKTKLLCLLGSPVAHSKSPAMHNKAADILGLDYSYLAFDVSRENLRIAVDGLVTLGARGWNLTMPLKVDMVPLCDELSAAARLSGAVNTVVNDGGKLIGYTTDGIGFMRVLEDNKISVKNQKLTLLGAGGAASAICVQAALDGASEIEVFKRKNASWDEVRRFCDKVSGETDCRVTLLDINDEKVLGDSITDSAALINATNVGMAPNIDETPVDKALLKKDIPVFDIIYNPKETRLMREAKEMGCYTDNGLYMLLYQGAESFKLWTGYDMPVEDIKPLFAE